MKIPFPAGIVAGLLLAVGCGGQKPAPADNPKTPEAVVQYWQRCVDENRFDDARQWSTPQAKVYIDYLDELMSSDTAGQVKTQLLNLHCSVTGDSAFCRYETLDEVGEKMPGALQLLRVEGRWLVDKVEGFEAAPVDTLRPGEENMVFPDSTGQDEEFQ